MGRRCKSRSGSPLPATGLFGQEEEVEKWVDREEQEEEKESQEGVQQPGLVEGGFRWRVLQSEPSAASQEEVNAGPRLGVQAAGCASSRAASSRRVRLGGREGTGESKSESEDVHLLSTGAETSFGFAQPGCEGIGDVGQGVGSAAGGRSPPACRSLSNTADCSGHCNKAGLAGSQIPGAADPRGRWYSTTPHLASCNETPETSGKSRRKGLVESSKRLAVGVGARGTPKRKRKRRQRKEQERERKSPRRKRRLGCLGRFGEGEARRCARKRRRCLTNEAPAGELGLRANGAGGCDAIQVEPPVGQVSSLRCRLGSADASEHVVEHPSESNSAGVGAGGPFGSLWHPRLDSGHGVHLNGMLEALSRCKSLADCGIWLAWGLKNQLLDLRNGAAGPSRAAGRSRSCGLFPLPVVFPRLLPTSSTDPVGSGGIELATECWLAVACSAINGHYGCHKDGTQRKPGKVHNAALGALRGKIKRFLLGEVPHNLVFSEVVGELHSKKVNYCGEEVSQPIPITAEQIERGLPPAGHGGSVDVMDFLVGRTKFLMANPDECVLPVSEWGCVKRQAKVHVKKGDEISIFELLRERGVIRWVPASTAYVTPCGPLLNGLFGVIKPGKFTSGNLPVLRVIMNLIPANSILSIISGDIGALPSPVSWIPLVIDEGTEIFMSQADMSSAFYLFGIPQGWQKYMCFNYSTDGADIGMEAGIQFRPACIVLPMGWSSSVGVMQQISRQVLLRKGLSPTLELRKGKPLPPWFAQAMRGASTETAWWQVYLDNFMSAELEKQGASGLNTRLQRAAVDAWQSTGILTADDKQVLNSPEVIELGVRLDGPQGLLGAAPERILKTMWASVHFLLKPRWEKKLAQIILGRWIFILQFRRAAMGVLSRSWETIETPWPAMPLVKRVAKEVLTLMCLAPLLQTDLRSPYSATVSCSDASETGGAAAISKGLTWSGRSLVASMVNLSLKPIELPVLVISVFNGLGAAFRIYDVLGVVVAGKIAVDISRCGNRVTRTTWPDVMELHNIEDIRKDHVRDWANAYPRVQEVHVLAGFPCVHLSSARANRQNLEGEGSKLFWTLLTLLGWVHEVFGTFCKVKHCIENVASMDESARREISKELDIVPIKLDPADCLDFSRPRLAWCSSELYAMDGVMLYPERDYFRALVTGPNIPVANWIRPNWSWAAAGTGVKFPTFMKAIRRARPPPVPAAYHRASEATLKRWRDDEFRFPPYQYGPQFLLESPDKEARLLDASERELLMGFGAGHTSSCMPASEIKKNWTAFEDARKSLCGDSFSVLSFGVMVAQMCAELIPRMSPTMIIQRMGLAPGSTAHPSVPVPVSRWLSYGAELAPDATAAATLVQQLGLTVDHTGSDVRVQTGQIMGGRQPSHGSVRAWWWQWKQLFRVRWIQPSHINYLEMKMILNTLLWKARDPDCVDSRWLHVEDSMVCLYILSKGRTSSRMLQPLCNRIGALQLGLGSTVLHAHVGSAENPTDRGSRL